MKLQIALLILTLAPLTAQVHSAGDLGQNLPAQKIRPNDLIGISVYGEADLTRTVRVAADGTIRLPILKKHVKADGLLPEQLEEAVAAALQEEQILVDPFVTVTVAEYQSRPISVAGAVKQPVTFQAIGTVTLLEAIARAGGLSPEAGPEILITRPSSGGPALVQRVLVRSLIDGADPNVNLSLAGGEEVRVPNAGKVFVVGNVKKPGAFAVEDATESTVLKMLALSEGLMPFAAKQAYIYRREPNGSKNEIPVDLRKIMDRKSPDTPLLANDILYVPDNRRSRATMSAIEKVVGFGSGATSALIYTTVR